MSIVEDKKLQQIGTHMHEADAQLATIQDSLNLIPPVIKVTKATKPKALQNRASKSSERNQCHTMQLDTFQDLNKALALKAMEALGHIQEARTQVGKIFSII